MKISSDSHISRGGLLGPPHDKALVRQPMTERVKILIYDVSITDKLNYDTNIQTVRNKYELLDKLFKIQVKVL